MLSTEICFNTSVYFPITHTTQWSFPLINFGSLFIPPCSVTSLTLLTSSPSFQAQFFSIANHYHIRHNSPHTHPIFFPFIVFECRHNIQPVSTAIPSPNSFRNITTIETHQHFGKVLKDIFKTVWCSDKQSTQVSIISIDFHFYIHKKVLHLHY